MRSTYFTFSISSSTNNKFLIKNCWLVCVCIFQHPSPEENNAHSGYLGYDVYIQTVTILFN